MMLPGWTNIDRYIAEKAQAKKDANDAKARRDARFSGLFWLTVAVAAAAMIGMAMAALALTSPVQSYKWEYKETMVGPAQPGPDGSCSGADWAGLQPTTVVFPVDDADVEALPDGTYTLVENARTNGVLLRPGCYMYITPFTLTRTNMGTGVSMNYPQG